MEKIKNINGTSDNRSLIIVINAKRIKSFSIPSHRLKSILLLLLHIQSIIKTNITR